MKSHNHFSINLEHHFCANKLTKNGQHKSFTEFAKTNPRHRETQRKRQSSSTNGRICQTGLGNLLENCFFLFVAPTLQIQAEINSILIQKLVPVFFHSILLVFFVFLATMFFFYKKFNRLFFERKVPNRCDFEQSIILSSFASFISFPPKKKPSVQFAKIFQVLSTQKNGQQTADSMKEYLTKVRTI